MEIIKLKIADLTPYENNAKEHPKKQIEEIKNSIKQFGFCDPVGIWGEKNIIVEGHGRVLALQQMGETEVECIRLDHLTDDERKAYTLAHNKTTLSSDFDFEKLEAELKELSAADLDFSMSDFGFDLSEFEEPKEAIEDEIPEVDEESEPITQLGDIWQLGDHRLMCGDSTDAGTVALLMDGKKADLLLTDPPYNVAYESSDGKTIQNDNMSDAEFRKFLTSAFTVAVANLKEGGAFYIWYANLESYNFIGASIDAGLHIRQFLIWNKNSLVLGRQDYQWKHEPCLYGWKDGAAHKWYNDRSQTTVLEFNKPLRNGEHPTMKPVELITYQTKNSSKENDLVLDLFGGSGTTLIACEQTGRICRMVEIDEQYCDVIIKRWENLTGQKAERIAS